MPDDQLPTTLANVDQERYYSIEEAAEELGVSPSTVRRRIKRGQLQAVQARIAQGYEWRIRLRAEDKTPGPPQLEIRQPLSLEETRRVLAEQLSTAVEALRGVEQEMKRQHQQIAELQVLVRELNRRLAEPWWSRWFRP